VRINTRVAIVLALLLFHFYTRHAAERAIPLSPGEGLYPYVYRVSLSLVAGRGFNPIAFPDTPEAAPLREFTMMSRAELSRAEMDAYFRQPYSAAHDESQRRTADVPISRSNAFLDDFHKSRVLDIRIAALLWKWFGVRWSVYFFFYSLVSTLAALCIFFIGRQAGGYWTGVIAMLFYTACPLENEYVIRSVRDISPLWFASFGIAFATCVAGSGRSSLARMLSYIGAGAVAVIGYGWRIDALMLPPFLLAFVAGSLLIQRRRRAEILGAAGLFVLGSLIGLGGIRMLTPGGGYSPQVGFHIADYGHAARANVLGMEDSLNIFRCDINTHFDARYYAAANGLLDGGEPYMSAAYGAACRAVYLDAMRYDSWQIVSRFPLFLFRALRGSGLKDLPINTDYFAPPPKWPAGLSLVRRIVLDPLYGLTPYLTIIGIMATLFWVRPVMVAALTTALLFFYAAILLSVLPEYKHTGLLILPISILSGLAVTSIANRSWRQAQWKRGGLVAAVAVGVWCVACGVAYPYSLSRRADLIASIRRISADAPEAGGLVGPRLFMVRRGAGDLPDRVGYLLEIDAGPNPGWLHCRSLRRTDDTRFYESSHKLFANRKQYFFMTSYLGAIGGSLSFDNTIVLDGDARIVSARKVDLSNWKGLEVSTVFYDGEHSPGSPSINAVSNRAIYGTPPQLDDNLLTADEDLRMAGGRVHQLVASSPSTPAMALHLADSPAPMSVPPEFLGTSVGAGKVLESGLLRFTTPRAGGQSWLQSRPLAFDREATIYVRIRYRLRKGNVALAVFPADSGPMRLCEQAQASQAAGWWTETVSLRRHPGQTFFFIIANGYAPLDQPTDAEISEVRLYAE
jgi:hypothetical protein